MDTERKGEDSSIQRVRNYGKRSLLVGASLGILAATAIAAIVDASDGKVDYPILRGLTFLISMGGGVYYSSNLFRPKYTEEKELVREIRKEYPS
ncbi:MAG: hypothetical protein ABIH37_04040 [archaeon]